MNKIIFVAVVLLWGNSPLLAQQDPQFTHYVFNTAYYNPAYVGVKKLTEIIVIHRSQWIGYHPNFGSGGSPSTQLVQANTLLTKMNSGVGLYVVNDRLGPQNNIEAKISYAYHLRLGKSTLSFGVRTGLYSQVINFDLYRATDPDDPLLNTSGDQSQMRPDFSAGLFFHREKYYGGISFSHIIKPQFDFGLNQKNELTTHVYGTAGYFYDINLNFRVQVAVLVRSDFVETTFDVSGLVYFKNFIWGGLSYRYDEAAILMLGYSFLKNKSLKVGYALDYVVSGQKAKMPTSHEFMVRYELPLTFINGKRPVRTPRYRH